MKRSSFLLASFLQTFYVLVPILTPSYRTPPRHTHCPVPFYTVVQLSPWGPLSHSVLYYEFTEKRKFTEQEEKDNPYIF